ncbi:MAG: dihydrofolate reductase family protein [Gemmatimonadaceae bacterium]
MTLASKRPRVICHMMTSVDGRIVTEGWPLSARARKQYELAHAGFDASAWICGRVTMEPFAKRVRSDEEIARERDIGMGYVAREDFRAWGEHESFAFAIDPSGRLEWESNDIAGDHVVAILSERVSDEYLAFLRRRGVSYLFAGAREVDLAIALEKIGATFGVQTVLLEGGGGINGGFLSAGLIDEVSVLVVPIADGRVGTAALFDVGGDGATARALVLECVEECSEGVVWLRYRVSDR